MHCMELGGAERSLLGLLYSIDYKRYQVDLLLYRHTGELLKYIPKEVNILEQDKKMSMLGIPMVDVIKKGQISIALGRILGIQKAKKFIEKNSNDKEDMVMLEYSHKYTVKYAKKREKKYDFAISFLTPHYYVAEKIDAKVKLAWIHTDYSNYLLDVKSELKMWSKYDYIASISPKCTEGFLKVFPDLKDKIVEISNINAEKLIRQQAIEDDAEDMTAQEDEICLCSVGRFAHAKNFDHIPSIAKKIKEKGIKFKWFIIGYGGEEQLIREKIKDENIEDTVIILGKKANPYPYIKKCDIYVQPSREEGYGMTVAEAKLLQRAIVITDFLTAGEHIQNGENGYIVPINQSELALKIMCLIKRPEKREQFSHNLKGYNYPVECKEKIYELFGIS